MGDNYYNNCPARGLYSRDLTDYHSADYRNEMIKYKLGIIRDDDYRQYILTNGVKMMDEEWLRLKKNSSCWNNACVHNYPTRMDPRDFIQQREDANLLFKSSKLPERLKCKEYADYRATITPLSKYKLPCASCKK